MPRKPRIEFPGAFYHIIARGNRKEPIFLNDADRKHMLDKLKRYKKRYNFILYAYALMDNHIHLLLETREIPLSKIMQGILQSHTQWFNKRYDKVGHLFQGRYKAILCDKRNYLLLLVRYIHLNPIRAGITRLIQCKYTSHKVYMKGESNDLVDTSLVLSQFSKRKKAAVKLYREFVREGIGKDKGGEFYKLRGQRILGDKGFYEEVIGIVKEERNTEDSIIKDRKVEEIRKKVGNLTGVSSEQLKGGKRNRSVVKARALFVRLSKQYTNLKCRDIALFLNRLPTALSYIEQQITDNEFKQIIRKLNW